MGTTNKEREEASKLLLDGLKKCSKCSKIKVLDAFNKQSKSSSGKKSDCRKCTHEYYGYGKRQRCNEQDCIEKVKLFVYYQDFVNTYPDEWNYLKYHNLMDKHGSHLIKQNRPVSIEECQEKALLYKYRGEFCTGPHSKWYFYAIKKGWLDIICKHMLPAPRKDQGFTRTDFVNRCKKTGRGMLYLIKCDLGDESFYKIGITCKSVRDRYPGNGQIPYHYTIIWAVTGEAASIWDSEKIALRSVKKYKYIPEIPFGGSLMECFKCHGNCKILNLFS